MSSIFNLGEVVKSFGRSKAPIIDSYLPGGYDTVRNLNTTLDSNRNLDQSDYNNYYAAFNSASPKFGELNKNSIDYLSGLMQRPVDANANLSNYLNTVLPQLDRETGLTDLASSRADTDMLAGLGLGNRSGGGSFGSLARTNRVSANRLPILNTIFAGAPAAAQSLSDQNYRDTLLNLGLLGQRQAMVDAPANRLLAPTGVRNQMLSNDTGLLNGIVNAMKNNVAGMRENTSGVQRWGNAIGAVDKSLNSAVDTGLSLYSGGMMGGGGGGGGMGSMLGGMGGGGGQGGGMNINQIMQMLNQSGRGGGYASGYERSNPYGNVLGMPDYSTGETQPYANSFYYP